MEKIQDFSLLRLTNGEHSTFHAHAISRIETTTVEKLGITAEMLTAYKAEQAIEADLIRKQEGYAQTKQLSELDSKRDDVLCYLINLVKTSMNSPIRDVKSAAEKLNPVVKPYTNSAKLGYTRETADIVGLTTELKKPQYADAIDKVPGSDIVLIELAGINKQFDTLMGDRTDEAATLPTVKETKDARIATDKSYNEIVEWANGAIRFLPSTELTTFIAEMNQLIDETRAIYNVRIGRIEANKEKKEAESKPNENV